MAYDMVALLAAVANDSQSQFDAHPQPCSGLALVRQMSNRSFNILNRDVYINTKRERGLDLNIFGLNTSTRMMQVLERTEKPWRRRRAL